MYKEEKIESLLGNIQQLPTLPGIALKLIQISQREDASLREFSDVLCTDPPLCTKVLKTINSPFYSLSRQITNVLHAVNLLGINAVKNLALCFSLIKMNKPEYKHLFDYSSFWKQSLIAALAAKQMTQGIWPDLAEDSFFLGLIHNIGILALLQCIPRQYAQVLHESNSQSEIHQAENQILGINHMQAGYYLTKKWGIPDLFSHPILHHHNPDKLPDDDPKIVYLTRILHLSSITSYFFDKPENSEFIHLLDFKTKKFGFENSFDLKAIVDSINISAQSVFPLFELNALDNLDYSRIIEEARNELINVSIDFMHKYLEQQNQIEKWRSLATYDGLTGLLNYQTFHKTLFKEITRTKRYNAPMVLGLIDLDNFKAINDEHGHLAGDYVLQEVARFFLHNLRSSDHTARYGGEEFAVIMPETNSEQAFIVMERLRKNISRLQIVYQEKQIKISMSIGITLLTPEDKLTMHDLINKADNALYAAKRQGKNKCIVN